MTRGTIHLIGGGWDEAAFPHTYGRFAAAVAAHGSGPIACVLLDGEDRDAYFARSVAAFATVGVRSLEPVFVSAGRPLREADVDGAAGVIVGGGLTPAYHDAIVPDAGPWLRRCIEAGMPYAGFSAGAMIAPAAGIIGGWKLRRGDVDLVICSEDVSEDEDLLDVRPGIGLVPFAIDVHAAQYGTPTRLMHAVRAGLAPSGWAIDEDTMLEVRDGTVTVHGLGSAWAVQPRDGALAVRILTAGEALATA